MAIGFEKHDKTAVFLNPFTNIERSEAKCHLRRDPLIGRTGRMAHFMGFSLLSADFAGIIEKSRENCPFCPETVFSMTPQFYTNQIPEGGLKKSPAK